MHIYFFSSGKLWSENRKILVISFRVRASLYCTNTSLQTSVMFQFAWWSSLTIWRAIRPQFLQMLLSCSFESWNMNELWAGCMFFHQTISQKLRFNIWSTNLKKSVHHCRELWELSVVSLSGSAVQFFDVTEQKFIIHSFLYNFRVFYTIICGYWHSWFHSAGSYLFTATLILNWPSIVACLLFFMPNCDVVVISSEAAQSP